MDSRRYRFMAPNVVTAANISAGFLAIISAARGQYETSVYLLYFACVLDCLDGALARLLGATSKFGQEMDSFSDALSFGAAPALLVYFVFFAKLGLKGALVCLIFLLAAVIRLARFNLSTNEHCKDRRTTGCPTPIAASYLMAAVLLRDQLSSVAVVVLIVVFAMLMVSRLPLPTIRGRSLVTYLLLVGIANYTAVVLFPSWVTVGWWNVWNVLILMAAISEDRRLAGRQTASDVSKT